MSTQNTSSKNTKSRAQNQPWAWWLEQYEAWESSGLSKAEFCATNKIKPSSFYNWISKLEKRKAAGTKTESAPGASRAFVPARIISTEPMSQASALSCDDITLQFDAIDQVNRHGHVLPAQLVQEGVLQELAFVIAHDMLRVQKKLTGVGP